MSKQKEQKVYASALLTVLTTFGNLWEKMDRNMGSDILSKRSKKSLIPWSRMHLLADTLLH